MFSVLTLSSFSGICLLILCLVGQAEIPPSLSGFLWQPLQGYLARSVWLFSIMALFRQYGCCRSTAAVIGAFSAVAFASFLKGCQVFSISRLSLGFLRYWLVSQPSFTALEMPKQVSGSPFSQAYSSVVFSSLSARLSQARFSSLCWYPGASSCSLQF